MAVPTDAADVFAIDTYGGTSPTPPEFVSGFPVDMFFYKNTVGGNNFLADRLRGLKLLKTDSTAAETTSDPTFDYMNGVKDGTVTVSSLYGWMWRRAPNYFDVVAYTGTGSAMTINHNLGVAPEMIWFKSRSDADNWVVYVPSLGNKKLYLNLTNAITNASGGDFNDTAPTDTVFSVGDGNDTNRSGGTHIAYLFASLDGVSKVGSFSVSAGQSSVVDCGFSSGARFVLIKRTDGSDYWWVFDTERGITVSSSPGLRLDTTLAESSDTYLTPNSSGFATVAGYFAAGDYIFYAIA